ncbi:heat shock 70 kDa protein F, mitochondrial-like [Papaver somniferum]|uniref:heat shock 70 kDa protein F, mitochondrial-like n=1 Tax=Papaver somniferum TaxID=3469 RepID=UPI000E705586|nr:heat shock 70 kDa protein F, mitochondrial-like [Papaver somniferum]
MGGTKCQPMSSFFVYVLGISLEAAESFSGRRVISLRIIKPPLFNLDLCSLLTKAEAVYGFNVGSVIADEKIRDLYPSGTNPGTKVITIAADFDDLLLDRIREIIRRGDKIVINSAYSDNFITLTVDLNDFLEIRVWEIVTHGDKTVLEMIVGELRRNGFDFAKDPLALQKVEQAVERAIARGSSTIKLNLPVTSGPEMSMTVSWGTSDGSFYARCCPSSIRPW